MKNKIYIIFAILLCSCTQSQTIELTPFTKQMVDMYVSAGFAKEDESRIEICSERIDERYISFRIDSPYDFEPIYGTYCGSTHYRGYEVIVYGDSIDGFFWSSTIPARKIDINTDDICESDRGYWYIGIDMSDTTVVTEMCMFAYSFPFPIDTINSMLKNQNMSIRHPHTSSRLLHSKLGLQ